MRLTLNSVDFKRVWDIIEHKIPDLQKRIAVIPPLVENRWQNDKDPELEHNPLKQSSNSILTPGVKFFVFIQLSGY